MVIDFTSNQFQVSRALRALLLLASSLSLVRSVSMRRTILSSARTVERVVTGGARSGGSSWARAGVAAGGVTAAVLWCGDQRFALLEQADARLEAIALSRRSSLLSSEVDDVRINHISPIASPALLIEELPLTRHMADHVNESRAAIQGVLEGTDDRLIVVVGPCSIHDVDACREYALRLRRLQQLYEQDLLVVMRVYFEKPRTTVGWKGLINDPDLNGTNNINKGLRIARKFLLDVNELGLVAGALLACICPRSICTPPLHGHSRARAAYHVRGLHHPRAHFACSPPHAVPHPSSRHCSLTHPHLATTAYV